MNADLAPLASNSVVLIHAKALVALEPTARWKTTNLFALALVDTLDILSNPAGLSLNVR